MIRRNSSKPTLSIINSAQTEHYSVTKGIRSEAPIVTSDSVIDAVNFECSNDGAFTIRKPLIKMKDLSSGEMLLFDYKTYFPFPDKRIVFKFYDIRNKFI